MDTRLTQTPCYYRQFSLSLEKALPYIFSKFNLLNTDTSLIRTLSTSPTVSMHIIKQGLTVCLTRAVINRDPVLFTAKCNITFSLWKQLTFPNIWPLVSPWNDIWKMTVQRDSTDELCHYTDLGSTSECSCHQGNLLQPIRSTTQIWVVTRHQYEISTVITQMSFSGKTSGGCFLRLHNIHIFFFLL